MPLDRRAEAPSPPLDRRAAAPRPHPHPWIAEPRPRPRPWTAEPPPRAGEETLLKIFLSRPICRELVDWLPIYPIRPPLPSIGCSIALNWPDSICPLFLVAVNVRSV
jgi:hypothetical protein